MRSWLLLGACATIAAAPGCGGGFSGTGTGGTSGTTGSTGTGTTTSSATTTGTTSGTGGMGGAGAGTTTTTGTTATTGTTGGSGGAAACPDVLGAYSLVKIGLGCADLSITAPQCIKATPAACTVLFASPDSTQGKGVTGQVAIDMNGDFSNGMITLGTQQRSGCTGTWNQATSQMAVNCGGQNASMQMCTATLTRTAPDCGF